MTNYFKTTETACSCGCGANTTPELMRLIGEFRKSFGHPMTVSSGARCAAVNAKWGGKVRSAHLQGRAIDFVRTPELLAFCTTFNLIMFGLYMEHPDSSPTWLHLTDRAPPSGRRIFRP